MSDGITKEEYQFLAKIVLEVQAPVKSAAEFVRLSEKLAKLGEPETKEGEVVA